MPWKLSAEDPFISGDPKDGREQRNNMSWISYQHLCDFTTSVLLNQWRITDRILKRTMLDTSFITLSLLSQTTSHDLTSQRVVHSHRRRNHRMDIQRVCPNDPKKTQQDDASHLCVPHRGPPFDPKFAAIEQIEYRKSLGATETRNGETRFELVSAVLLDGPR
jgi:hypothetical protein